MRNLLTKNHLTIKKIFNKFLTQPRKAFQKMTGYQKLKIEKDILWGELEDWLYEFAKTRTNDKDKQKEIVEKEMAYIEWRIEGETK